MLIEFHCTCGHRQPLEVAKLKAAVRCSACKSTLQYVLAAKRLDSVIWLTVGGQTGPPRLAVPVPVNVALSVGSSAAGFLSLPGEEISESHAELKIEEDGRLLVKHVAGDSGTWINRAKIITGVLGKEDRLRVGPYVIRRQTTAALTEQASASLEPEVVVEIEADEAPRKKPGRRRPINDEPEVIVEVEDEATSVDPPTGDEPDYREDGWTGRQKIRAGVCAVLILAAAGYLAKTYFMPSVSAEMPELTVFYCPADGSAVRGKWSSATGAPICPQCGQRCVGELKYKAEPTDTPPPAATSQSATVDSGASGESGDTVEKKEETSGKKRSKKKKKASGDDPATPKVGK